MLESESLDIASPNWIHGIRYSPTPLEKFYEMLAALPIGHEEFTFVDFGSGKGRGVLVASDFPFKAIVGLEFSPHLHHNARRNLAVYQSGTQASKNLKCLLMDATLCDVPLDLCVCYLFNPFRESVMARLVRRLEDSLQAAPRQMFILYYVPMSQHLLKASECFHEFRASEDYTTFRSHDNGA